MKDTTNMESVIANLIGCPAEWVQAQPADRETEVVIAAEVIPVGTGINQPPGIRYLVRVQGPAMVAWGTVGSLERACARVRGELELDGHLHYVRCSKAERDHLLSLLAAARDDDAAPNGEHLFRLLAGLAGDLGLVVESATDGSLPRVADDLATLAGHALSLSLQLDVAGTQVAAHA